ncbi:cupin domain-containing protein [Candidatus Bathyarchaeota archaeon]|nr:cupin domain-containing protein [Candidatus Bathyarchaeota archaeon]
MKVFHYTSVKSEDAGEGSYKTEVRWLLTKDVGAENFAMRLFEIQPEGYTPLHKHPWEHEVFVLEGEGTIVGERGEKKFEAGDVIFVPPNELHQFKNAGEKLLKFLCLIPYKRE